MISNPFLAIRAYGPRWALLATLLFGTAVTADDCVPVGSVLMPASGKQISVVDLIKSSAKRRIVLLGEHHDNMEHHRWQLQMITGLHSLDPQMVLGFEMFPRQVQGVLDEWVAGTLSEEAFLQRVNWDEYWSFDPQLYLPLFHFARMNSIPIYALNVDRTLIREVGRQGWGNVSEERKEGVSEPAAASEGYRQLLANVFMQHGENHAEGSDKELVQKAMAMPGFARFVESQQVWDRAMAQAIAEGARANPDAQFVAVLGSGHMMYDFGVPEQLADLGMPKPYVLIPWDPEFECDYIQKNFADAVIGLKAFRFSEQRGPNDGPRLGVYLDAGENGVVIKDIVPDSVAEGLGLKPGDLIVGMAGSKITEVEQVIDIVKSTHFGTWLPLKVKRADAMLDLVAKFPPQAEQSE